jgi:hypothetical protein
MEDSVRKGPSSGPAAPPRGRPAVTPTRNPVSHTGRQFRGKFFSEKNQRHVKCESLLEMRVLRFFEAEDGVKSYSEQPCQLSIRINGRRRRYTPDLLVTWRDDKPWLVEVKPSEIAETSEMRAKLAAAKCAAEGAGYRFVVLTERFALQRCMPLLEELIAIRRRLRTLELGSAPSGDVSTANGLSLEIFSAFAGQRSLPLSAVIQLLGGGPNGLLRLKELLAHGSLSWDIMRPLSPRTRIFLP